MSTIGNLRSAIAAELTPTGITEFDYLGQTVSQRGATVAHLFAREFDFEKTFRVVPLVLEIFIYNESYDGMWDSISDISEQTLELLGARNNSGCVSFNGASYQISTSAARISGLESYVEQGDRSEARHFKAKVTIDITARRTR
ncbi:putative virion structural protein [Acaryochloris phage A-HIS2]|nr:putative virion structural protein [Acaryochloris phage A-HIS2]